MVKTSGVKYKDSDYAGLLVRLVILSIDLTVVSVFFISCIYLDSFLMDQYENYTHFYFAYVSLVVSFIYLTKIKTTKIGTLGQVMTGTRIETIYGTKPGLIRMTARLLFWLVGPLNFVIDLMFLAMIKEKRAVRDCICNTIVVKKSAAPIETGVPIRVTRVLALGLNLMYESCNSNNG